MTTNLLPIVISGAGPSGLLLSLWLTNFGVRHRIVDPNFTTGTISRALVVHARTLEFYDQLGFSDRIIDAGAKLRAVNITYGGHVRATVPIGNAGIGQSRFPFILSLGQDAHEAVLLDELRQRGGDVEWGKKVTGLEELDDRVRVTVEDHHGRAEVVEAAYVAGCDGAHSAVRKLSGLRMEGGTYDRRFFVADVEATGTAVANEATMNICLTANEFCLAVRMKGDHRARLVGFTPEDTAETDVTFEDCLPSVTRALGTDTSINKVNWFSHYKVHHRHADKFQKGRSFVFGDAAHLHSPVGGQGMNTGLGDVTNFAWKPASIRKAKDSELESNDKAALIATYNTERLAFAESLVSTTDVMFQWIATYNTERQISCFDHTRYVSVGDIA